MSKQRVIVEAVLAGKSQGEVARLYGISQPRVSQLVAAWRAGGWDALEPKSRRPQSNPNATGPDVVARVLALRAELIADGCDAGPHSIAAILDDELDTPPGVTTIWRILTRAGVITPEPRKRPKRSWIRFEAHLPNECWQADFTHVRLATGRDAEVLLWVDDHSRYLVSATAHAPVTGRIVVDTFRAACAIHGTPQSTLTDNGFVFTTRHRRGPNAFEIELHQLGIAQKNGTPNHPQTQGKVERLNQTLKRWLGARSPARDLRALQQQLDAFTDYYNTKRPHRSLNRRTPAEAYAARAKASPEHNSSGHFRIRDDTVHATGSVTLRRGGRMHHIKLGMEHAGTHVRMLIHDLHVIVIDRDTGEILRELTINPDNDSQPRGVKPGPRPGHRKGMPKGYKFPKK
ncbi:MAG: IS481 family transposase [Actinobacteria bacterium]|nr:IS481 family transposase [Actinomycetota bacterium]